MKDFLKKAKPTLESLLADSKVLTGMQLIAAQKQKEVQAAEFAKAAEFEQRHKKAKR